MATGIIAVLPTVALAAGETYVWKDAQHSAIVAQGGPYASATEFAKAGTAYVATAPTLNCTNGTRQRCLLLFAVTHYNNLVKAVISGYKLKANGQVARL